MNLFCHKDRPFLSFDVRQVSNLDDQHAGKAGRTSSCQAELQGSQRLSKNKVVSLHENDNVINNGGSSGYYDNYLWFGPRGNGGRYLGALVHRIFLTLVLSIF